MLIFNNKKPLAYNLEDNMMKITTETGSVYILDTETQRVKRENPNAALRKDDKWLRYINISDVEVGKGITFLLEPLGEGDCTLRQTSYVTEIE